MLQHIYDGHHTTPVLTQESVVPSQIVELAERVRSEYAERIAAVY